MTRDNGFATKADLKKLEQRMGARFVWFREEIKIDLEEFRESFAKELRYEWDQKIDPILGEIAKHREQEVIWAEQNRRTWDLLEKVAVKVGVPVNW